MVSEKRGYKMRLKVPSLSLKTINSIISLSEKPLSSHLQNPNYRERGDKNKKKTLTISSLRWQNEIENERKPHLFEDLDTIYLFPLQTFHLP